MASNEEVLPGADEPPFPDEEEDEQPAAEPPENPDWVQAAIRRGDLARAVNAETMAMMARTGEFDLILAMIQIPAEAKIVTDVLDAFARDYPRAVVEIRGTFVVVFEKRRDYYPMI